MNCTQAKQINLFDYIKKLGFTLVKTKENQAWFLSPFRSEKTPSFKIDTKQNIWYDFGEGCGGNIIDFILKYKQCDIKKALQILGTESFSFHQQQTVIKNQPNYTILSVDKLKNQNLLNYLKSRKINIVIAQQFCIEIHYTFNNLKKYYGVGFKNNSDGYEIRNKYFKGCLGKKNITSFITNKNTVCVFESWSDFLSYLTLKNKITNESFIILNSTAMVKKVVTEIKNFKEVKTFFDNDEAGSKATNFLIESANGKVIDNRIYYKNFNDLNDCLMNQNLKQSVISQSWF
ncbi:hypothetical protein G1K63_03725 [Tenacibaculum finnmarkense]|uniref:toprim domain-containing protein n=1 Tax=Tenacibaculum finnmarkense TaxID=2781243 RepID=UPI001E4F0056|nr:toprim domain-containing protein [Tenacibaculum finnmarkense]MCD8428633.1 toprim domain-containing protein [Tenacibaculum finnmarkense genomovar ulcerans]MCG8722637.1 hypothetical protein [Tenacibaculum finnmarkense]